MLWHHSRRAASWILGVAALIGAFAATARAQVSVLTQHNDNLRTGQNLQETVLTPAAVTPDKFGKLFARQVDGEVYAQPLYVSGVTVPGKGVHNVLYVATMNNSLYAFDADDPAQDKPLWVRNFGIPIPQEDVQCCCRDISTKIGILSTPVIDDKTGTLYLVSRNKMRGGIVPKPGYQQWIRAIDIASGGDKLPPRVVHAKYRGLAFDPRVQNQRAGLTLAGGSVYVAWASHNDCGRYSGWVMRFNAADLSLQSAMNTSPEPTSNLAGIWQSGQGLTVDEQGNLYFMTGNGTFNGNKKDGASFGCTFLKVSSSLNLLDWFTPNNVDFLNAIDADLGSAGVLALPGTQQILGVGKEGKLFLIDRNQMGGFSPDQNNVLQSFQATNGHVHGSPVYYNSPEHGPTIFVWSEEDFLKAFSYDGAKFNTTPSAMSEIATSGGMPGGFLSISADGATAGTGILWASLPREGNANQAVVPGVMRAFALQYEGDAETKVLKEIWNSEMMPERDTVGYFAKFCPPTIANGKVYLPTFGQPNQAVGSAGQIMVYGPLGVTKPQPPTNLKAVAEVLAAQLSWDPSYGSLSYNLYRGTSPGGEGNVPYLTGLTATALNDLNLSSDITYYYQVTAVNDAGESARSNEASVKPLPDLLPVPAIADTHIDSFFPFNFGRMTNLSLKPEFGQAQRRIFLKFDLTNVPDRIDKVTLRLYGGVRGARVLDSVYPTTTSTWTETGLTWANQPTLGTLITQNILTSGDIRYHDWDITTYVKAEVAAGRRIISLAVLTDDANKLASQHSFNAREASANKPSLDIVLQPLP